MPSLGMGELIVILMLALLVFGASRLPQIGEGMGRAIKNFKQGLGGDDDIDVTPANKQVAKRSSAQVADATDAEVVTEKKS